MVQDLSSFQFIPMATFNSASMTSTFQSLNGTGFAYDIKIFIVINTSTQPVTISYDGVTTHDYWPAAVSSGPVYERQMNLQTNHACNSAYASGTLNGRAGQIVYGKGTAGTGNIYIIGIR